MTKLVPIIIAILLSAIVDYTTQDLPLTADCKRDNSPCTWATECCSGRCREKCISQCQPVNAACDKQTDICCNGLQCEQSAKTCCRLAGQRTLTPSECCSLQWIPNSVGCGGTCTSPCKPVNVTCDNTTSVCCNGLQCGQSTKKCCRLAGQTTRTPSECCSLQWIPNSVGCGGICTSACKPVNATCNNTTAVCCNGLQCEQSTKTCCRLAGETALTRSECCSQSWRPNSDGGGGKCCSQHAGYCVASSDCCDALDMCSNSQWPNMCV